MGWDASLWANNGMSERIEKRNEHENLGKDSLNNKNNPRKKNVLQIVNSMVKVNEL